MPRRPRIKLAEVPQHVVQRGINRELCFFAHGLLPQMTNSIFRPIEQYRRGVIYRALITMHE